MTVNCLYKPLEKMWEIKIIFKAYKSIMRY